MNGSLDTQRDAVGPAQRSWFATLRGPFAYRTFASIWVASLVGNIGGSIQTVAASWQMASMAPSPAMVSLVQTASTLPIALFALMSGVASDAWDRRTVMLVSQSAMLVVALGLAALATTGAMTPARLLACMFVAGCAGAMFQPAWQSAVTEQVPARELSAAIALDSFSLNFARTAGPSLGGLVVAWLSPQAAFIVSACACTGLVCVLSRAIRGGGRGAQRRAREPLAAMLMQGARYCFGTSGIRGTLIRCASFGFFGSPVWALLPLFARTQFGGDASTYGVLLASFGAGAASGALGAVALRARFGRDALIRVCTLTFAAGMLLTAWSPFKAVAMLGLAVAGGSWVATVSTYNLTIQTASPAWVAGRSLALFHSCIIGGLSLGSYLWGVGATSTSINLAFTVSGALMAASACLAKWLPLPTHEPAEPDSGPQQT
ncbi:MFS transporter [Burkholderia ubonensis]|uniref:MFS transporter n=1 Tax=Burkholderia ubonensis subsp. mesacidophila TaxID=265293 RepID=A0A2A4FKX6_9BURK|nr:MFS transporter [Burkholderia ubonensis]PCE33707.1 MFS transporter [Burkholderia ubonensis subsp. mesacidophila]